MGPICLPCFSPGLSFWLPVAVAPVPETEGPLEPWLLALAVTQHKFNTDTIKITAVTEEARPLSLSITDVLLVLSSFILMISDVCYYTKGVLKREQGFSENFPFLCPRYLATPALKSLPDYFTSELCSVTETGASSYEVTDGGWSLFISESFPLSRLDVL